MKFVFSLLLLVLTLEAKWYKIKVPYQKELVYITSAQIKVLQQVITYSRPYARGWHIALAAMCISESSAGIYMIGDAKNKRYVDLDKASLGVLHIRVPTVRYLVKKIPKLKWLNYKSDYYIAQRLLHSVKFSSMIAGYLMTVNRGMSNTPGETITRYNGGHIPGHYYKKYKRNRILVNKLIELHLLHRWR